MLFLTFYDEELIKHRHDEKSIFTHGLLLFYSIKQGRNEH